MFMDLNQQHCLMSLLVFSLVPEGNMYPTGIYDLFDRIKKNKKENSPYN